MIMLITHHDEKINSFQIYDVASTLFFVAFFCHLVKLVYKKKYSLKYSLSSKKGKAEAEIYIYTITILNLHIVQT
jgi:hypothetical protein